MAESNPDIPHGFQHRIETDPEFRDAYYNTTSAHLYADPEKESTTRLIDFLQANSVAYFFEPDEFLPRPIIQTEFGQFTGEEEILRALTRLVLPSIKPRIITT